MRHGGIGMGSLLYTGDFAVNSQNSLERVTYDGFNEYRL